MSPRTRRRVVFAVVGACAIVAFVLGLSAAFLGGSAKGGPDVVWTHWTPAPASESFDVQIGRTPGGPAPDAHGYSFGFGPGDQPPFELDVSWDATSRFDYALAWLGIGDLANARWEREYAPTGATDTQPDGTLWYEMHAAD